MEECRTVFLILSLALFGDVGVRKLVSHDVEGVVGALAMRAKCRRGGSEGVGGIAK
jgi:hypothetical protein